MTHDELEAAWRKIESPAGSADVNGTRVPGLPLEQKAYMAVDKDRFRLLLLQVPDEISPIKERKTRSLEVSTGRYIVGSNEEANYISLKCLDQNQNRTFNAVVEDIVNSLAKYKMATRDSIIDSLARWQSFWTARPENLSREDALGLFGELWFLLRWIGLEDATALGHWQATDRTRHDFQWPEFSVEVKTASTQTAGIAVHHIASLEQLADPEIGLLYLFSLQVKEDALSANTLHSLVSQVRNLISGNYEAETLFLQRLSSRNYSPDDRGNAQRPLRVIAEQLYCVTGDFPRLLDNSFNSNGLPAGVSHVSYDLDLAACKDWLCATTPGVGHEMLFRISP